MLASHLDFLLFFAPTRFFDDSSIDRRTIFIFKLLIENVITDKPSGCPFILVSGTEKQEQWFLWKAITGKEYIGSPKEPIDSTIDDSNGDFARLIGLSGFHFIVQKVGKYHEIMEKDKQTREKDGRYRKTGFRVWPHNITMTSSASPSSYRRLAAS